MLKEENTTKFCTYSGSIDVAVYKTTKLMSKVAGVMKKVGGPDPATPSGCALSTGSGVRQSSFTDFCAYLLLWILYWHYSGTDETQYTKNLNYRHKLRKSSRTAGMRELLNGSSVAQTYTLRSITILFWWIFRLLCRLISKHLRNLRYLFTYKPNIPPHCNCLPYVVFCRYPCIRVMTGRKVFYVQTHSWLTFHNPFYYFYQ